MKMAVMNFIVDMALVLIDENCFILIVDFDL